jgi:hypothetical protein
VSGPVFTLFDSAPRNHYVFTGASGDVPETFDVNDLEDWLELAVSNRLARFVKKQKVPTEQTGPVQVRHCEHPIRKCNVMCCAGCDQSFITRTGSVASCGWLAVCFVDSRPLPVCLWNSRLPLIRNSM